MKSPSMVTYRLFEAEPPSPSVPAIVAAIVEARADGLAAGLVAGAGTPRFAGARLARALRRLGISAADLQAAARRLS